MVKHFSSNARPCKVCAIPVTDCRPPDQKICFDCSRKAFCAEYGVHVLNWDQVLVNTKGARFGHPKMNSAITIRCAVCQGESTKVVTPKTLTNGHLARCSECAYKAKRGKTKAFAGRKHSEETKSKMRKWWVDQKVYGPARSEPVREKIEKILGGPIVNWKSIPVTINGNPPDYQDLIFHCQKCSCLSSQQFRGMTDISPMCGACMKASSYKLDGNNRYRSSYEVTLEDFLKEHGVEVVPNHTGLIKSKDLDLFLPDYNIAIEIDGLWTHCEVHKPKGYHLTKTDLCDKVGVRLIHIFEDEITDRMDIVKSRLLAILGKHTGPTVGARKCTIATPAWTETMAFLKENHIQGACQYTEGYGLQCNGELIALMTFSKARPGVGGQKGNWELVRFAVKQNYNVPGAASRLLKAFLDKHGPVPLHSFADRRWSVGDVYTQLGFRLMRKSPPNYWYIVKHKREHRFKYRKDRLIAAGFDPKKSEHAIMFARKLYRIYDCGTLVYGLNC